MAIVAARNRGYAEVLKKGVVLGCQVEVPQDHKAKARVNRGLQHVFHLPRGCGFMARLEVNTNDKQSIGLTPLALKVNQGSNMPGECLALGKGRLFARVAANECNST